MPVFVALMDQSPANLKGFYRRSVRRAKIRLWSKSKAKENPINPQKQNQAQKPRDR